VARTRENRIRVRHRRRARFRQMSLRSVLADRLSDLARRQLTDQERTEQERHEQRGEGREECSERDVAKDVEDAVGAVQRIEKVIEHHGGLPASSSNRTTSAMRIRARARWDHPLIRANFDETHHPAASAPSRPRPRSPDRARMHPLQRHPGVRAPRAIGSASHQWPPTAGHRTRRQPADPLVSAALSGPARASLRARRPLAPDGA